MLPLPNTSLDPATAAQLAVWQGDVDEIPEYAARIAAAKRDFKRHNTRGSRTFRAVRAALDALCPGPRRCMYCEDSCATDIEHHRPKEFYPEFAFVWENYLYACQRCNRPKSTRFAVFSHTSGSRVDIRHPSDRQPEPPEPGSPLLLDPRYDDPREYLRLDLTTFLFVSTGRHDERARYTLDRLTLNDDPLPRMRQQAFDGFSSRLHWYISKRDGGADASALERIKQALRCTDHPTVWFEMKRQHVLHPDLQELFALAPEALYW